MSAGIAMVESAACIAFEAMNLDAAATMPRSEFLQKATDIYDALQMAVAVLSKTPDELSAVFKSVQPDGTDGSEMLDAFMEFDLTANWLHGFGQIFDCVVARGLVAASRAATKGAVA